ncbi:hypothetical protein [Pleomorphomonas sp. NRK KF1]|uniref:hypothetical protein n=1 Tax=Pleomorphomonas sp. NRK KF1 TaxID=2943000 RepID=UPI002043AA8F|nr:hypothetical protein [Pleomorphomonas sp. NRK KF1]MCM5554165.1 hypothetical protein [Pleomorphomonas sp. NRK KF1]
MKRIIDTIDRVIDVLSALTGQRPEGALWTTVEQMLVGVVILGLLMLAVFVAVTVLGQ